MAEKRVCNGLREKFENAVNLNQDDHPVSERNLLCVLEEYIDKSSRSKEENQSKPLFKKISRRCCMRDLFFLMTTQS